MKGGVFRVLWAQPAGEQTPSARGPGRWQRNHSASSSDPVLNIWVGNHGGKVFQDVKMFVVVREGHNYCTAVQITSYQDQGVSKYDVLKAEHAMAYTGNIPPKPLPSEAPRAGESGMLPVSIRIVPDAVDGKLLYLKKTSRINFGKPYTIEHNIRVQNFGSVHVGSLDAMISQFLGVHQPHWILGTTNARVSGEDSDGFGNDLTSPIEEVPSAIYKIITGSGVKEQEGAPGNPYLPG